MKSVSNDPKVESAPQGVCTLCGHDPQEVARRIEKSVDDAKAAVAEKLEDGKIATERFLRRGRYAVEDGMTQVTRNIKRNPFGSLAIAFAAGAALALLVPRPVRK